MVVELATFIIKKGNENDFESSLKTASKFLHASKGYISHQLRKGIEQENKYVLTIHWETLEDHTLGFRESENFKEWRKLLQEHFENAPAIEHFNIVLEQNK